VYASQLTVKYLSRSCFCSMVKFSDFFVYERSFDAFFAHDESSCAWSINQRNNRRCLCRLQYEVLISATTLFSIRIRVVVNSTPYSTVQ